MSTFTSDLNAMVATLDRMVLGVFASFPALILAGVAFALFWFGAKFVRAIVTRSTRTRTHANVGIVLGRLAQWVLVLVGGLIALSIVAPSIKPANIISVLGIGSVAIGFAFKDILQNFLAGILLLLNEPFKVGDQIVFKTYEGTVEDIEMRSTRLKTYDGRRVIIPNGEIYTSSFVVNTAHASRRSEYEVGIGYGDDLPRATEIILDAMKSVDGVLTKPAPDVIPVALAGSSVNVRARWWTDPTRSEVIGTTGRVITAIKLALDKAAIDMPFPTQVVLFHDQTEEVDGDRTRQREGWPAGRAPPPPRRKPRTETADRGEDRAPTNAACVAETERA